VLADVSFREKNYAVKKARVAVEIPDPPSKELGAFIRRIRNERNLSQNDLADLINIRAPQVSRIENGGNVQVEQYERVARALGFRNAFEMFQAPGDPLLRRFLRYWPLLDEGARKDMVRRARAIHEADEG
jgi:transcriptional regulator with XRE-family HTH domain